MFYVGKKVDNHNDILMLLLRYSNQIQQNQIIKKKTFLWKTKRHWGHEVLLLLVPMQGYHV